MPLKSAIIPQNYDELKDAYIDAAAQLHKIEKELEWYRRQFFGKKSERVVSVPEEQLSLFPEEPQKKEAQVEPVEMQNSTVKRAKPGRKPIPKHIPRVQVYHIPEEVKGNEDKYEKIDEEIREILDFIPATLQVIQHIYPKYKLKDSVKTVICQAPAAYRPILKGMPSAGLIAHVTVNKYCDHLPLDRQERIFARQKIDIPKSTMANWIKYEHEILSGIREAMKLQIISCGYILSDSTGIKVLDKTKQGKTHNGCLWVYGDLNQVVYEYTRGKGQEYPNKFLEGYSGYLQTDGYEGYNNIPSIDGIIRMGCWAHARRKFFELDKEDLEVRSVALKQIGALYEIERLYWSNAITQEERCMQAEALQAELKLWLESQYAKHLPSSATGMAIKYALNQWERLTVYQRDGRLKIDNNFSERCIKSVVIGRKNWMFAGSHDGAERGATMYSLIESCKLLGVNPYEYLKDVLSRLEEPGTKAADLTPLNWAKNKKLAVI